MLSYQIASAVSAGTLRLILRAFEPEPLPVHLVYASQSLAPLKLRAFLDFAAPPAKGLPGGHRPLGQGAGPGQPTATNRFLARDF